MANDVDLDLAVTVPVFLEDIAEDGVLKLDSVFEANLVLLCRILEFSVDPDPDVRSSSWFIWSSVSAKNGSGMRISSARLRVSESALEALLSSLVLVKAGSPAILPSRDIETWLGLRSQSIMDSSS